MQIYLRICCLSVVLLCTGRSGLCVFAQSATGVLSAQVDLDTLTSRIISSYRNVRSEVDDILPSMQPDGSWKDIDYTDAAKATFAEHAVRLKRMAIAYSNPKSKTYESEALLQKLQQGFAFFYNKKWVSTNWWYTEIGIPNDYMVALILLKGYLPKEQLLEYASFLKDATDKPSHQGMNRIWVSSIIIHKGCIIDDPALVQKGFTSIASTLRIVGSKEQEGIKNDDSFHQHRKQIYAGGYGLSYVSTISDYLWLSAHTEFAKSFTPAQINLYHHLVFNGTQLFGFYGALDFGVVGRNISRPNGTRNINPGVVAKMAMTDPLQSMDYINWMKHLQGGDFPEAYQGNRFFWNSAIMTQHGPRWYLSAKMISKRTTGTEMLNNENLQGYNLPLGATNIMVTGKEYNGIFPSWDWSRIPGTTAIHSREASKLPGYLFGTNDFAGGVTDSLDGLVAYEHAYRDVLARKAYFFVDGRLLCLGTGITAAATQEVLTSLDQSLADGTITYGNGLQSQSLKDDSVRIKSSGPLWVYHHQIGYLLPQGGDLTVQRKDQEGSWKGINAMGKTGVIKQTVFSAWLSHGSNPKGQQYAYLVVPGKNLREFKKIAQDPQVAIVKNDTAVQAIKAGMLYAAVFYQPGTVDFGEGMKISTDQKVLILVKAVEGGYRVSVADPLYSQLSVHIRINNQEKTIALPQGDLQGSTVQFYLNE
ncbi:chondroitin AC lyase [bacterium A37T11]|nr:chondroitin AC lyase [bacterium A37T11]